MITHAKVTIKVTSDKAALTRIWDAEYAEAAGKTIAATIMEDGWACSADYSVRGKFPPEMFEIVENEASKR